VRRRLAGVVGRVDARAQLARHLHCSPQTAATSAPSSCRRKKRHAPVPYGTHRLFQPATGALTAFVAFEQLTRFGVQGARTSGVLLIAAGLWMGWQTFRNGALSLVP
jgi:hypothetical protein